MDDEPQQCLKSERPEYKKMRDSGEMEDTVSKREESERERRRDRDVPSVPENRGNRSPIHSGFQSL